MSNPALTRRVRDAMRVRPSDARELELALSYIESDPGSSLTKIRMVLEHLVIELHVTEMGDEPRKPMLGEMLSNNQLTRRIERRIISRMNAVRDIANLGAHGERVEPTDAEHALDNLLEIVGWYAARTQSSAPAPPASQSAPISVAIERRRPTWILGIVAAIALALVFIVGFVVLRSRRQSIIGEATRGGVTSSIVVDLHDGERFSSHYRTEFLKWSPAPSGSDVVEIQRLELDGQPSTSQPLAHGLTAPQGDAYLRIPWESIQSHPGRYRVRVVRGEQATSWIGFSYFANALERFRAEKELHLGVEKIQHLPFVYWDALKSEYVGFDVELVQQIAEGIVPGARVKPLPADWATLVPSQAFSETESPAFDLVASAVSITPERCTRFSFSHPYLRTGQRMVRVCGTHPSTTYLLGVQRGTTSETQGITYAKTNTAAKLQVLESNDRVFDALKHREVDAILVDDLLANARPEMKSTPTEWCFEGQRLNDEDYGILAPLREVELVAEVNRMLAKLVESGAVAELARVHGLPEQALHVGSGCER